MAGGGDEIDGDRYDLVASFRIRQRYRFLRHRQASTRLEHVRLEHFVLVNVYLPN